VERITAMNLDQILPALDKIFREELDNDTIKVSAETSAKDIAEWDSLSHIRLVVAIEKHFETRFTSQEIQGWKNVGDMCASIIGKSG
jgi:acyl carrier protein